MQKQEPLKSGRIQNITIKQSPQNHRMAIKIQSAYRSYITRQKLKQNQIFIQSLKLAEKGPKNQIKCNSTEDFIIEYHTNSYSPIINQSDVSKTLSSIQNNQQQRAHQNFKRQLSLKLKPKEIDQSDFEEWNQNDQTVFQKYLQSSKNCPGTLKNQKEKINSFNFRCVLTLEILQANDQIKLKQQNHKRKKFDTIKLIGGNTYNGEWLDSLPDGKGKYIFSDQSYYLGEFVKGLFHGKGEFKSKEGTYYRGQWQYSKMHGQGIYNYNNGCKYEGSWEKDLPNGKGIEWYANGSVYVGNFLDGEKHGTGKLTFNIGEIYEGEFQFDNINGLGTYRWQDGRIYEGEWFNGKMNGKGLMTWPDGRSYKGEYLNDQKHGFGIFSYFDGRKYIGQWENGLQHGQGEFHKGYGIQQITKGIWKEGQLVKLL
ncbi:unnamed protein product [Paramecium primaurelia]|uniref:MORN repeat protein n=1 Tax=Paramecium primaurelia TaxID=5886 RepID=A0A8S1KNW0_PARPR|nr:unnamed protein product [Paramecium primaurelia]